MRPEHVGRAAAHSLFAAADFLMPGVKGPRILIYHQVGSGRRHEMNLPEGTFRRQIEWLRSHRRIVSLEEAVSRRGEEDSDRLVVLTFDDGYADVFRHAFPVLWEHSLPFTLYLTTGPVENREAFEEWPGEPLSWEEAREMLGSNLATVGVHTHTHPDLRGVTEATARWEVEEANRLIGERLGVAPRHFAYPKGWWSPTADQVIRRTYDTATLGVGGTITADSDVHLLSRVAVNRSEPFWVWKRKLGGGGRTEDRVRRQLHGYRGP